MKMINGTEAAILSALVAGDLYGLALIDRVKRVSRGKIALTLGSVYPTVYRMEQKGLVRSYWGDDSETKGGARRRYYRITGLGERQLRDLSAMLMPLRPRLGDV